MSLKVRKSRVLLAIGDTNTREALGATLRLETSVCEVATVGELLEAIERMSKSVVVIDLSLCTSGCGELIHRIRELAPGARLIVWTPRSEEEHASAIEEGVFYYAAGMDAAQLAEAVRAGLRLTGGRR